MTTILLAEDEAILRELLTMELEEQGFGVHAVSDGRHAIEWLQTNVPDLILVDLLMPVADGFAVMEFLQQQRHPAPVIVLSNLSTTDQRERCLAMGAKDVLVKSNLEEGDLLTAINKQLVAQSG